MFGSHQWAYSPWISLIPSWMQFFPPFSPGILWQRCWINMIFGYLFRFCNKANSNMELSHDCATSALMYLNRGFGCWVAFAVWCFHRAGAVCFLWALFSTVSWHAWKRKLELTSEKEKIKIPESEAIESMCLLDFKERSLIIKGSG